MTSVIALTERKNAEIELRESEDRYRAVVEQAAEGIVLFDVDSKRVLEVSVACQTLLGYIPEAILRLTLYGLGPYSRELSTFRLTYAEYARVADGLLIRENCFGSSAKVNIRKTHPLRGCVSRPYADASGFGRWHHMLGGKVSLVGTWTGGKESHVANASMRLVGYRGPHYAGGDLARDSPGIGRGSLRRWRPRKHWRRLRIGRERQEAESPRARDHSSALRGQPRGAAARRSSLPSHPRGRANGRLFRPGDPGELLERARSGGEGSISGPHRRPGAHGSRAGRYELE